MKGLDWEAPIAPGRTMLGLSLGESYSTVRQLLEQQMAAQEEVALGNTPRLTVDYSKENVILLRAKDMDNVRYAWQDVLARLIFTQDVLTSIIVLTSKGDEAYAYKGKMFDRIRLGSSVQDMQSIMSLEYDPDEELFIPVGLNGLEIGGSSACDLPSDPTQFVTFIRIF